MLNFEELNFIAIIVATLAKNVIGGLWYSKYLFSNIWLAETGLKMQTLGDPKKAILLSVLSGLLFSFTVGVILSIMSLDLRTSLAIGVIMAIGISGAQMLPSYAFEGRSFKLYLIYTTQYVVEFIAVILVLSLM